MEWRAVPYYPDYLVSEYGDVKKLDGYVLVPFTNNWGYLSVSLCKKGKYRTVLVHRLVASAFIDHWPFFSDLVPNHRNLDKRDNHYSNLEWLTVHENNIHAGIVRGNKHFHSIYATSVITGEKYSFSDVFSAADKLEMDWLDVWDSIRLGDCYAGWKVEFSGLNDRIPTEFHKSSIESRDVAGRKPKRKLKVKNVLTGEIKIYQSISDFCRESSISSKHVNVCIQKRHLGSLLCKKYQLAYGEEELTYISPERLEYLLNYGSKEVLVFDFITRKITLFKSATETYKTMGWKKAGTTENLRIRGHGIVDNYLYVYNESTELKEVLAAVHNCPELC